MYKGEFQIDDETKAEVVKLTEARNARIVGYNERHPDEKKEKMTIADMCSELITTGAFRRVAANRWADENKEPAKPRAAKKAAAPKAKKVAAPKVAKKVTAKKAAAPRVRKPKAATVTATATSSAPAEPAPAAAVNGSPLD